MDAYTSEMEVGRKTDTWKEVIDSRRQRSHCRHGSVWPRRLGLHGPHRASYAKRYDRETRSWVDLESKYKAEIEKAIRIIQGKRTQDVMYVPATKLAVQ